MPITLTAKQKQRRDSASNFTSANPVLLAGELAQESDTQKWKVGDGSTAWTSLAYIPIPDVNRLLAGNLTVGGDLTVSGTTTTINTATLTVEDKNIELGKVSTPSDTTADGGGITLKGATDKTITWTDSTDSWDFNQHVNIATGKEFKVNNVSLLEDSVSSTSTTRAATSNAVKTAKDAADSAQTTANTANTTASAALPKAGGDMTGNLVLDNGKEIRLSELDSNGSAYVGIKSPDDKGSEASYTVSLPAAAPTANQILKADASTPTNLTWATDSGGIPTSGGSFTGKVTHNYTSSIRIPSGTTAQRDGSAAVGDFRWNTTLEQYEGYDGSAWGEIGGSAATGSADLLDIASSSGTGGGSATFNGTAYRFKLVTKGTSTAVTPANAEILTVSINGILQKPNDGSGQGDMTEGYVVSGTDIIFDSPPAASSDYFIVNMGTQIAIGNASTVTVADESSDTTCFPTFVTGATGDLAAKTGSNLTFNSSSGQLAATSFAGDGSALTGIAGATADGCLYENDRTLSNNYTIASGKGAHCVGPLTISATLTINGRLVIS